MEYFIGHICFGNGFGSIGINAVFPALLTNLELSKSARKVRYDKR